MSSLVYVPLSRGQLASWVESGVLDQPRCVAITSAFCSAFGFVRPDDEAAEYTALCVAGVWALTERPERLVAVCQADVTTDGDDFGRAVAASIPFASVTSLFGEGSGELAAAVHAVVGGQELDVAWDDPTVETLLAQGDLLWHGPSEWGRLV